MIKIEYVGILKSSGTQADYQLFFKLTGRYSFNIFIEDNLAISKGMVRPNTYNYGWTRLCEYKKAIIPDIVVSLIDIMLKESNYTKLYINDNISTNEKIIYSAYFTKLLENYKNK